MSHPRFHIDYKTAGYRALHPIAPGRDDFDFFPYMRQTQLQEKARAVEVAAGKLVRPFCELQVMGYIPDQRAESLHIELSPQPAAEVSASSRQAAADLMNIFCELQATDQTPDQRIGYLHVEPVTV